MSCRERNVWKFKRGDILRRKVYSSMHFNAMVVTGHHVDQYRSLFKFLYHVIRVIHSATADRVLRDVVESDYERVGHCPNVTVARDFFNLFCDV